MVTAADILPVEEADIESQVLYGRNSAGNLMMGLHGTTATELRNLAVYGLGEGGGGGNAAPWAQVGDNDPVPETKIPPSIARVTQVASGLAPLDEAQLAQVAQRAAAIRLQGAVWAATTDDVGVALVASGALAGAIPSTSFLKQIDVGEADQAGQALVVYRTVADPENYRVEEINSNGDVVRAIPLAAFTAALQASVDSVVALNRAFAIGTFQNSALTFTALANHAFRIRKSAVSVVWEGGYKDASIPFSALEGTAAELRAQLGISNAMVRNVGVGASVASLADVLASSWVLVTVRFTGRVPGSSTITLNIHRDSTNGAVIRSESVTLGAQSSGSAASSGGYAIDYLDKNAPTGNAVYAAGFGVGAGAGHGHVISVKAEEIFR